LHLDRVASTPSCSTGPRTANRSRRIPVMGTAEGNRPRPEEHTTGAPLARQAIGTARPMTAPGQTGAIRRAWWPWRPKRGGVADPRGRGESADPFGINDPAGRPEPRGPLMSPGFWLHHA